MQCANNKLMLQFLPVYLIAIDANPALRPSQMSKRVHRTALKSGPVVKNKLLPMILRASSLKLAIKRAWGVIAKAPLLRLVKADSQVSQNESTLQTNHCHCGMKYLFAFRSGIISCTYRGSVCHTVAMVTVRLCAFL